MSQSNKILTTEATMIFVKNYHEKDYDELIDDSDFINHEKTNFINEIQSIINQIVETGHLKTLIPFTFYLSFDNNEYDFINLDFIKNRPDTKSINLILNYDAAIIDVIIKIIFIYEIIFDTKNIFNNLPQILQVSFSEDYPFYPKSLFLKTILDLSKISNQLKLQTLSDIKGNSINKSFTTSLLIHIYFTNFLQNKKYSIYTQDMDSLFEKKSNFYLDKIYNTILNYYKNNFFKKSPFHIDTKYSSYLNSQNQTTYDIENQLHLKCKEMYDNYYELIEVNRVDNTNLLNAIFFIFFVENKNIPIPFLTERLFINIDCKLIKENNLPFIPYSEEIYNLPTYNFYPNKIYYGNSGTGKTYKVLDMLSNMNNIFIHNVSGTSENELIICVLEAMTSYFFHIIAISLKQFTPPYLHKRLLSSESLFIKKHHIFIDEFNRNLSVQTLTPLNYLFDIKIKGFSGFKMFYLDEDTKNHFLDIIQKFSISIYNIFFEQYNCPEKDYQNQNLFQKHLDYLKYFLIQETPILKEAISSFFELIMLGLRKDSSFYNKSKCIPIFTTPNLFFSLTMNTGDYNTTDIDIMFNRRFDFEYVPYDLTTIMNNSIPQYFIEINENDSNEIINWQIIQTILNEIISQSFHESKCIGYYFWNENIITYSKFKNKIIYYLYNVVLTNNSKINFKYNAKDDNNSIFFKPTTFEKCINTKNIKELFSQLILNKIFQTDYNNDIIFNIKKDEDDYENNT
jgi:hypothetical protein